MKPLIKVDSLEVMLDEPTMFELHREGGRYLVLFSTGRNDHGGMDVLDRLENPSPENDTEAKTRFRSYIEEYRRDYSMGFVQAANENLYNDLKDISQPFNGKTTNW